MKRNNVRILAILLVAAMLLGMVGCGSSGMEQASQDIQLQEPIVDTETIQATEAVSDEEQEQVFVTPEPDNSDIAAPNPTTDSDSNATEPTAGTVSQPSADAETVPVETVGEETILELEYDRESMELVAELLGGDEVSKEEISQMDDVQLDNLVNDYLQELENTPNSSTDSSVSIDPEQHPEDYDENGAMTKPFDQIYPELIEEEKVEYDDETLLIKLSNARSGEISDAMAQAGVAALEPIVPMDESTWYEAKLIKGTVVSEAVESLRTLKEVQMVDYNYEVRTSAMDDYQEAPEHLTGNAQLGTQWYLHYCGIYSAMAEQTLPGGSSSVVVAVIDTGVDYDHEDLADNIWVNSGEIPDNGKDDDGNGYVDDYYGVNIVAGKGSGDDDNGHGTHVAGIIAAQNNNLGTVGIAYNVKIMPIKAAMASGYLTQADIAKAILYAYENGAEVINMSFGGTACSIAVQDALSVAYSRCVLVASAGNDGAPNEYVPGMDVIPNYPAALTYVLGVMSVDNYGRESSFTNFDVKGYNGVEYELYAPGQSILSTIPGDRYASWSGTSMAAPVVSAMAAILRSEYSDREAYPTRFIYGQLAATSEDAAICLDPEDHGTHNLPSIVNLYSALTKLPQPDVGLLDWALFDTEDVAAGNNGDGVIDAGETIALGLTLINRWGMSEDTIVTIDANSSAGIPDPYVTIQNSTVDYGSIGTYSTGDCGRIYTDELLTGWEDPFYITIAEDCPNDYIIKLNVTISCGNGMDPEDENTYTNDGTILLTVRNGVVLPQVIDEDMVWTKDNYYIISNSTVITEGTTVRVEPGTNIQFWSNDPEDPYADSNIAYLRVDGNFLVEGTKEKSVKIFPSELMWNYSVIIYAHNTGYISMRYAEIINLDTSGHGNYNGITYADHCTVRFDAGDAMLERYLDGAIVETRTEYDPDLHFELAENCVFLDLRGYLADYPADAKGSFNRCVFTESGVRLSDAECTDCVFLGNFVKYKNHTGHDIVSSYSVTDFGSAFTKAEIGSRTTAYYNESTDKTYLTLRGHSGTVSDEVWDFIREYAEREWNGGYAKIETEEELNWLIDSGALNGVTNMGLRHGPNNTYLWYDGTQVADFLVDPSFTEKGDIGIYHKTGKIVVDYSMYYSMYEIPGKVLPNWIGFEEYERILDLEDTFQIAPLSAPMQLEAGQFLYESTDEAVLTVDGNGLVTPVGLGTADVYVYTEDKACYNYITFNVMEYVPLEDLIFDLEALEMGVSEADTVTVTLIPENTTRRDVVFSSSDESILKVDEYGNVTTLAAGTASIIAQCEGITKELPVTVIQKTTTLKLDQTNYDWMLDDGMVDLPTVTVDEGAVTELVWRNVDEDVAVLHEGKSLILIKAGTTTLEVTDLKSGLSARAAVRVWDEEFTPAVHVETYEMGDYTVLLENGDLYNGTNFYTSDAVEFAGVYGDVLLRKSDDTIERWKWSDSSYQCVESYVEFVNSNPTQLEFFYAPNNSGNYWVFADDGMVYVWGNNEYGQLGLGYTGAVFTEDLNVVPLEGVVDVIAGYNGAFYLTENGDVYYAGRDSYKVSTYTSTPKLVASGISRIYGTDHIGTADGYSIMGVDAGGRQYVILSNGTVTALNIGGTEIDGQWVSAFDQLWVHCNGTTVSYAAGIRDGHVYMIATSYDVAVAETDFVWHEVEGIDNAQLLTGAWGEYIVTCDDGKIYYLYAYTDMDGVACITKTQRYTKSPAEETLEILGTNLSEDNVLIGNTIEVEFNKGLRYASGSIYQGNTYVSATGKIVDLTKLQFTSAKFVEGVEYTLRLYKGYSSDGDVRLPEQHEITFTWQPAPVEETVAPVYHESVFDREIRYITSGTNLYNRLLAFQEANQLNPSFYGNAILNRISTDTDVTHWMRPLAPETNGSEVPFGSNYWGTTNQRAIEMQMVDYSDFITYGRLMYEPYLTEAPENTFPFAVTVELINKAGESVSTVGSEEITFRVRFNRDMDTTIPLRFTFGSAEPYADYTVEGSYVDDRTWEGKYAIHSTIANGMQYVVIDNGCSATDDLILCTDTARFGFVIDTTAAQALIMQGSATDTGIELSWTQDDFDTLMGYNVYRSTSEDGYYQRLNSTVIPADTKTFFDDTVEPGIVYYYNFTVVKTDLTESTPSGKISIMSKDTMAPNIYHTPVYTATMGANLIISATVTDNLDVTMVKVFFRTVGQTEWKTAVMNRLNDKFSAIIPADQLSMDGLEYYIEASDGLNPTYKGSDESPYVVTVQEAVSTNSLGDVNGDGKISNLDALMLLQAINDLLNLTSEQFTRADLDGNGILTASEALRILQYVSGAVGSVDLR